MNERLAEVVPSETATVTEFVLGPWDSEGVQERALALVTVMPVGPETTENVRVWAGRSISEAERVRERV